MNSSKPTPIGGKLLARIWRNHRLGDISSLSQPPHPGLNPIRFVNDRYVIRFYTSVTHGSKPSQGEARAFEILASSDVPVPEVIALGFSGEISPFDYLITTRLAGRPLVEVWPQLSKREKKHAAHTVGAYLAQIHTNDFQQFGYLSALDSSGYAKWYDFVYDYYAYHARRVQRLEIFEACVFDRIQRLLQTNRSIFDQVTLGVLIHSDFQFKHILYQSGNVTGVLDFERALSGDPAWDFVGEDDWPRQCPGSLPWLYQQYKLQKALDNGHETRVSLYKLLMYLVSLADPKNIPAASDLEDARTQITGLIEMLEGSA